MVADLKQTELSSTVLRVLREAAGAHRTSFRSYVQALGLRVRVGDIYTSGIEVSSADVLPGAKPDINRTVGDVLDGDETTEYLGVKEVSLDRAVRRELERLNVNARLLYVVERRDDFSNGRVHSIVGWALASERSSTPYGPKVLRDVVSVYLGAVARFSSASPWDAYESAIYRGSTTEALRSLCDVGALDGAALWLYDSREHSFDVIAETLQDRATVVVRVVRDPKNRRGIVSQVAPSGSAVVYDRQDRSLWRPPTDLDWRPFDEALYKRKRWHSCIALPISHGGRLLGALTCYSTLSARHLIAQEETLEKAANTATSTVLMARERAAIYGLTEKFDQEILRSNVSMSALSLSHDLAQFYRGLDQRLSQAVDYQASRQYLEALSEIQDAKTALEKADPVIEMMRSLTFEARNAEIPGNAPTTTDLQGVVNSMASVLKVILPTIPPKLVLESKIFVEEPIGLPRKVAMSKVSLERIILNLCVNSAQWRASEIRIRTKFEPGRASLTIKDNGRGIRPEYRERVFDRFFSDRGGSGLGLYVVKRLVTNSGGSIKLQSKDDSETIEFRGTTMTVALPTVD